MSRNLRRFFSSLPSVLKGLLASVSMATAVMLCSVGAIAQTPVYVLTTGVPNTAINNSGLAVGSFLEGFDIKPYQWVPFSPNCPRGELLQIPDLGGGRGAALGVNDNGYILGWSLTSVGATNAFRFDPNGTLNNLGVQVLNGGNLPSEAYAMTADNRYAVGWMTVNVGGTFENHAFRYDGNVGTVDLSTNITGRGDSAALDMNENYEMVGYRTQNSTHHGWVYRPQSVGVVDLGIGEAVAINAAGYAVGWLWAGEKHAMRFDPNGSLNDLGVAVLNGGGYSEAFDINASAITVGSYVPPAQSAKHAFAYFPATGNVDLNTVIDPALGYVLTSANSINDKGQILVSATKGGSDYGVMLTPVELMSLSASPNPVAGGNALKCVVEVNGMPSKGDVEVLLKSSDPAVTVPSSVIFTKNTFWAQTVLATTTVVDAPRTVTVTATYDGKSVSTNVTVKPASLLAVKAPSPVVGGTTVNGQVTLDGPAGTGGLAITLASSNAALASVPGGVTVAEGQTTATFPISTTAVSQITSVTISATAKGIKKSATIKVRPIGVKSLAFSPTTVRSAGTTTGTVTLEAPAGPGSITVTLASGNVTLLQAPASITIPVGSQTGTFAAHAGVAAAATSVTVKATANAITKSGSVKVLGAGVAALTLSPTTVKGGTNSTATISLDAPPTVNTNVTLSSNASGVARFVDGVGNPITNVVIPVGQKSAQVTVHSYPVAISKTATLKASANGLFSTAALTVTP